MYYFLEGAGTEPICRACLSRSDPGVSREWGPGEVSQLLGKALDKRTRGAKELRRAVRSLLLDELGRVEAALVRFPSQEPDAPLVRDLDAQLRRDVAENRLTDALATLRELRWVVSTIEGGRRRAPLSVPWDESVDELFERVMARSRAMAHPPLTPEEEAALASLSAGVSVPSARVAPSRTAD
jgi:hypothetical protein